MLVATMIKSILYEFPLLSYQGRIDDRDMLSIKGGLFLYLIQIKK